MKRTIQVVMGDASVPVGALDFSSDGRRESVAFTYDPRWLGNPKGFAIDPSLPLAAGPHFHKRTQAQHSSAFFGVIADTEADGWGRQIIARNYVAFQREQRASGKAVSVAPLSSLDYLLAVADYTRVGALRFIDEKSVYQRAPEFGRRDAPPLVELRAMLAATTAFEQRSESARDLRYLLGRGTSLGGLRPKCSVIDDDGTLSIGKFPSVGDTRSVTKGEVLALRLAKEAGINAAVARTVYCDGAAVALIRRFDREGNKRILYASARTLLGANDDGEHSYTEIADAIRQGGQDVSADLEQLWRRMVYNVLITNVDDHLNNHGFLHSGGGKWMLAPAFDINPFPDKARLLKTWISEEAGPEASIESALSVAPYFGLSKERAARIVGEVESAVGHWRRVAASAEVGMSSKEMDPFVEAFEHSARIEARRAAASIHAVGNATPTRRVSPTLK